jgi:hypothetical protein
MILPSLKIFEKDYSSLYKQADIIFNENNLCKWEKNENGSFSCIVNRLNTQKNKFRLIEIDGCCIYACKNVKDYENKGIRKKQHNTKKGCTIKNLKCKLHSCQYLRESNDLDTKEAIRKIDQLITIFRSKYDIVWESNSYGTSKKMWIEYYKFYRSIFL